MIFQHTLPQVLSRNKTQTRRVVTANHEAVRDKNNNIIVVTSNGRIKWQVGQTYAVQPGRGKPQVARIKITGLDMEPVTAISEADAIAEGYETRQEFFDTWVKINGEESLNGQAWVVSFELVEPGSHA